MIELTACPLCRSTLEPEARQCPSCAADLSPYYDLNQLTEAYYKLCLELISRGELEQARQIARHLPEISELPADRMQLLAARLALAGGEYREALQLLSGSEDPAAAMLRDTIEQQRRDQAIARELYNHALSSARQGGFASAAEQLERAVLLDPTDPAIWQLKLKADLKCSLFQRCYSDLAALDLLTARPPQFHRLEELLPPVAGYR